MTRPDPTAAATPEELTSAVERAYELIAALRTQVEAVLDKLEDDTADAGHVFKWAELDADTARATWNRLYDWVTWLLDRYAVREIPRGCWWNHGMLVEELTALWQAWQASYHPTADATAPVIWHDHLDRARERIRIRLQQQGNCAAAGHQQPTSQPNPPDIAYRFAAFIDIDAAVRRPADDSTAHHDGATGRRRRGTAP